MPGMAIARADPLGTILAVKVVPGASRERIVGLLGDRLKVAVQKPAQRGAANKAVCALVAAVLGVRPGDVQIVRGQSHPEKDLLVRGLSAEEVLRRLPGKK
jgi:hypothetical protein